MIKISVVIPSYKPGAYLNDCIESLMSQTLESTRFEVIVVLNGIKEPYYAQIERKIQKYSHVKVIYAPIAGVSNARNIGIEASTGEYLCFVDDDDMVSPTYLEKLLERATTDTVSISNVYSFKYSISEQAENFFICKHLRQKERYVGKSFFYSRSFLSFPVAKMIHRDIISSHRFDTRFNNGEDSLFITSITDNFSNIAFASDDAIYYVRERIGSASRKKIKKSILIKDSILLIYTYIITYLKHPMKYDLRLFLYRIPGVIKNAYLLSKN